MNKLTVICIFLSILSILPVNASDNVTTWDLKVLAKTDEYKKLNGEPGTIKYNGLSLAIKGGRTNVNEDGFGLYKNCNYISFTPNADGDLEMTALLASGTGGVNMNKQNIITATGKRKDIVSAKVNLKGGTRYVFNTATSTYTYVQSMTFTRTGELVEGPLVPVFKPVEKKIKLSVSPDGGKLNVRVLNETEAAAAGTVYVAKYNVDGTLAKEERATGTFGKGLTARSFDIDAAPGTKVMLLDKNNEPLAAPVIVSKRDVTAPGSRETFNFDYDWVFAKGVGVNNSQSSAAEEESVVVVAKNETPWSGDYRTDERWANVSLPHTYNDIDTFDRFTESGHNGERSMYTGTAWYKKSFSVPAVYKGKKLYLEFEAARQAAVVYINGKKINGVCENGFIPFGYDITDYVKFGEDNDITVMVDNSFPYYTRTTSNNDQLSWHDSHWHPTHGGLYRNVYLHVTDPLHVTLPLYSFLETQGTYLYTSKETKNSAVIHVESEVENGYKDAKTFTYTAEVVDMSGNTVLTLKNGETTLAAGKKSILKLEGVLENAIRWSDTYPYLYTVVSKIMLDGKEVDRSSVPLGIRTFRFTTDSGFYLNGNYVKLEGWGQKSTNEWAGLGAAYPDWMHDYVIKLMKDGGGNFIRWGHTAGSPTQITSSDKYGLLTIQPGVDGEGSTVGGVYSNASYAVRAAAFRDLVIYYRNNPSITIWEIGNQSMPPAEAKVMAEYIKTYDHHGGSTSVSCGSYDDTVPSSKRVVGVRRGNKDMVPYVDIGITTEGSGGMDSDALGRKPEVEGEYNRAEARRGVWDRYTEGWKDYKTAQGSSYNLTAEEYAVGQVMHYSKKISALNHCGGANWHFSDSTSMGRVSSEIARASGEVDATMLEKEAYYALKVIYSDAADIYLIGHWNYSEGTTKPVYVVSDTEKVELFLNGVSLGFGEKSRDKLFTFKKVKWRSGTLTAIGYDAAGKKICESSKSTHGKPASIKLTPMTGPGGLQANGSDILLIDAEVVDAEGNRCLTYDGQLTGDKISFALNDDNGCSIWRGGYNSGVEYSTNRKSLYIEAGITRVAVRTTMKAGDITVSGSIPGLKPATLTVTSKEIDNKDGLFSEKPGTPGYNLKGLTDPGVSNEKKKSNNNEKSVYQSSFVTNFSYTGNGQGRIAKSAVSGESVYSNTNSIKFGELPQYLQNAEYIQTDNTDRAYTAIDLIGFTMLKDATVYIVHDDRVKMPDWLAKAPQTGNPFKDTGENIAIARKTYSIYKSKAQKGETYTLGGNLDTATGNNRGGMYVVFFTQPSP